ncbi:MAG TPA: sigma-E factor regulatory protein RseB domain-containing protein [Candidatus Acidoferrales bacterium]|nr:sigma-E factor regulatory protein RseB domain-containing protein [Candidatus Acidoferrales bacterium]
MSCIRLLLLLCGALVALGGPARADGDAQALDLLRDSISAPRAVSYVGQVQTVRFSTNGATATLVRVEHKAPSLTRRWYLAPEALYGDYTITRGIDTYEFDTRSSRVLVSKNAALDDDTMTENDLSMVIANYHAVLDDDETIADRKTTSILLLNKYTGERAMRVWIDDQTHLVLQKEEYHSNGAVASQTRFEEIRFTNQIPSDIFSTDVPPGFTTVQGRNIGLPSSDIAEVIREAGFTPYVPKDLPQGFNLVGGNVSTVEGIKSLHLMYSDGLRTISLFENDRGAAANFGEFTPKETTFEGHGAQYIEDGPTTLLTWEEHGLHFALVGDLELTALVQVAISVVP